MKKYQLVLGMATAMLSTSCAVTPYVMGRHDSLRSVTTITAGGITLLDRIFPRATITWSIVSGIKSEENVLYFSMSSNNYWKLIKYHKIVINADGEVLLNEDCEYDGDMTRIGSSLSMSESVTCVVGNSVIQKIKEAKNLRVAVGTYYFNNLNMPIIRTWLSVFLENKESGDLRKWEITP